MNPSRTLLNTAVRDIGLRSVSMDRGCGIFPKGRTSAHFHNDGQWPSLIDELKMELIGRLIPDAKFFNNQLGIPSGPTDLRS